MRYGDIVTIESEGIRIQPKELEPVGIFHESSCWGICLPDFDRQPGESSKPPNILLSPFRPESWPILVRLELRLAMGTESLLQATRVLRDAGLNILTYDCTHSGYHHLTWTLVGEHEKIRLERTLLDEGRQAANGGRLLRSEAISDFTHKRLAPAMLSFCTDLCSRLENASQEMGGKGFLHPAFADAHMPFGGKVYSASKLKGAALAAGSEQEVRAVRVRWLQDMAFFWLYSDCEFDPAELEYDAINRALRVKHVGKTNDGLTAALGAWPSSVGNRSQFLPKQTLALFDTDHQYVRIMLSASDVDEQKLEIEARYSVDVRNGTTRGLLHAVIQQLQTAHVNVLHVSNAIATRRDGREKNRISIIAEPQSSMPRLTAESVQQQLSQSSGAGEWARNVQFRTRRVIAHNLFVSARFAWPALSKIHDILTEVAGFHGFCIVLANGKQEVRASGTDQTREDVLLTEVSRCIRGCSAFLQIVHDEKITGAKPKSDNRRRWMHFELGVAAGLDLPRAICVDTIVDPATKTNAKLLTIGSRVYPFNSGVGDAEIRKALEPAVVHLRHLLMR